MAEMARTYLIQRLKRPIGGTRDNPFSFGGGVRNGGLSDEAMGLLRNIWSFDYMGRAEFEFGVVPKALQRMAKAKLSAFTLTIPLSQVPPDRRAPEGEVPVDATATIYVIAPTEWASEVTARISDLASSRDGYEGGRLCEPTMLPGALRPFTEWDSDTCGWLELDNGFVFFTDEEMWRKTCQLFGVPSLGS